MFCQRCGTKNFEGAAFCSGCGAPLATPGTPADVATPAYTPPAQPAQAATVPQRRGGGGRRIAVIVAALAVAYVVDVVIAVPLIHLAFQLSGSGGYISALAIYRVLRLIVYAVVVRADAEAVLAMTASLPACVVSVAWLAAHFGEPDRRDHLAIEIYRTNTANGCLNCLTPFPFVPSAVQPPGHVIR